MEDSPLVEQSKSFALDIIKLCNQIKIDRRETVLVNQLMLSGASIGARVREAYCLQDRNDFIKKLQDALKDCSETEYWIELLVESGTYYSDRMILEKCIEIKKMLMSTIAKESEAGKSQIENLRNLSGKKEIPREFFFMLEKPRKTLLLRFTFLRFRAKIFNN